MMAAQWPMVIDKGSQSISGINKVHRNIFELNLLVNSFSLLPSITSMVDRIGPPTITGTWQPTSGVVSYSCPTVISHQDRELGTVTRLVKITTVTHEFYQGNP